MHFGIVAIMETSENVEKWSDEIDQGKMLTIKEIDNLFLNPEIEIENYTRISWPYVKEYLF